MTSKPAMMLWLSDSRGIYIPRDFAQSFVDRDKHVANVDAATWAILETGPDHKSYWDAWSDVTSDAVVTDEQGHRYTVWQDGDCWLIPEGMEWSDEAETFAWPETDDETE